MVTVHRVGALKIQIYADDHVPPHFRIVGPDFELLILISGLTILKGARHRPHIAEALEWARENVALLEAKWSELND